MKSRGLLRLAFVAASLLPAAAQAAASAPFPNDGPGIEQVAPSLAWRVAQATTNTSSTQSTTDEGSQGTVVKPRHHKKTVAHQQQDQQPPQRSGAAIVKEGGKTCSGLDEYRVCW